MDSGLGVVFYNSYAKCVIGFGQRFEWIDFVFWEDDDSSVAVKRFYHGVVPIKSNEIFSEPLIYEKKNLKALAVTNP